MPEKPIISKLFSFVTIRNPQLLTEKEKERGFIYFPSSLTENSAYLVGLDSNATREERRTYLSQTSNEFTSFENRKAVRNTREELHEFSLWLMKNKNIITKEKVEGQIQLTGIEPIPEEETIIFWDNLFYQINTKKSDAVRESTIQLIVANNFLLKNDISSQSPELITNDEELRRLANAYVVIPDKLPNNSEILSLTAVKPTNKDYNILNSQLKAFEARKKVNVHEKAIQEIKSALKSYKTQTSANYNQYFETYKTAFNEALSERTLVEDPETGEVHYENFNPPEFTFEQDDFFNPEFLDRNLSAETITVLDKISLEELEIPEDLLEVLDNKITIENRIINEEKKSSINQVKYNNATFSVNKNRTQKNSYAVNVVSEITNKDKFSIDLNISTGSNANGIKSNNIDIILDGENRIRDVELETTSRTEDSIIVSLRTDNLSIGDIRNPILISGTIVLDDDTELEIATPELTVDGGVKNGFATDTSVRSKKINHRGIKKIGVADFRKVEQEVCCYVPGEVSRIENILAKEYRERSTRQLLSTENITEDTSETEVENLTDTTTTIRNELATEISSVIDEQESENYGASAGVKGSYPGGTSFYADAYFEGASSSASSNSNSTSQTHAEETVEKALERVVQKTKQKRTSRILREFEENNKHGFDNRQGESHVTGVYRWVDKIYKNRLVNYGKRLMYEFSVPEPSRFFKDAILQTIENNNNVNSIPEGVILPPEPVHPDENLLHSGLLTGSNYQKLASKYNATVEAPPENYKRISMSFSHKFYGEEAQGIKDMSFNTKNVDLEIPEGYYCDSFSIVGSLIREGTKGSASLVLKVANKQYIIPSTTGYANFNYNYQILGNKHHGILPISFTCDDIEPISFNITAVCKVSDEATNNWQNKTYKAIKEAYYDRLQEYNDALYANFTPSTNEEKKIEFNPLLNRTLEKRELKRLAVQMLSKPFNIATARNHYSSLTDIMLTDNLDKHASYIRFFEQAFDWEIMAYIFYPYYYGDRNDWQDLFQQSNGTDPVFQAFLQSGMARMTVPVRPGFEEAVTYFLETGDIWMGRQLAVDMDDDLYVSIAEELQSTEGTLEKEWETRVPTDLTIVQADSAPLNEKGLPCCHTESEEEKLGYGSSIMTGSSEPTT